MINKNYIAMRKIVNNSNSTMLLTSQALTGTISTTSSTPTIGQGYWTTPSSTQTTSGFSNAVANILYFAQGGTGADLTTAVTEIMKRIVISDGDETELVLPDGTENKVNADGSYTINDKHAQVIYRASRIREFNPFLNASDKLEAFIRFCGEHGVRQGEMLDLPVRLFVAWLVVEAAKADKHDVPDVPLLPDLRKQTKPRCRQCQRFIRRLMKHRGIDFCGTSCFEARMIA